MMKREQPCPSVEAVDPLSLDARIPDCCGKRDCA